MGADVVNVAVAEAGVHFDFQSLGVAGHQGFLHAVESFIQADTVCSHVLEERQVVPFHADVLQDSRSDIVDDLHALFMGVVVEFPEFFLDFFSGLVSHRQQAGKDPGKPVICSQVDVLLDVLHGIVFGVNRDS